MGAHVDAWVQIACPRLSVDWGHFFDRPVLTSYELEVAVGQQAWRVRALMRHTMQSPGRQTGKTRAR